MIACAVPSLDAESPQPTEAGSVAESPTTTDASTPASSASTIGVDILETFELPEGGPFYEGGREHNLYIRACLALEGIAVEVLGDGRLEYVGNDPNFSQRFESCADMAVAQGYVLPIQITGQEGLALLYDLWMGTQECLEAHGFPTVAPPSKDSFVESGGTNWHPYAALPFGGHLYSSGENPADAYQLEAQEACTDLVPELLAERDAEAAGG